jgi:hypothetical protein
VRYALWALLLAGASGLFAGGISTANAVQTDAAGNIYLAGYTLEAGLAHAFVAKLSPDASQTIWWTVLAGTNDDRAIALALGPGGSLYVTGTTQSTDFPVTSGASSGAMSTPGPSFAAELNSTGSIAYATYLPSTAQAIAVDSAGHAFITGTRAATDTLQPTPGTVNATTSTSPAGSANTFILELDPTGSSIVMAVIGLGGAQIALDSQGNIYAAGIFGLTSPTGVQIPPPPTTTGAFQTQVSYSLCWSGQQGFGQPCSYQHIAKIDPTGTNLIYATYVVGQYGATPGGLAVDSDGNAILAGTTNSPDYPTTPDTYEPEYAANPQSQHPPALIFQSYAPPTVGYVTKLNASGTGLVWSTFFGGSGAGGGADGPIVGDSIAGMAVDASGNILFTGLANSPNLPGLWNIPSRCVLHSPLPTTLAQYSSHG